MNEEKNNLILQINSIVGEHKAVILKTEPAKFSTIVYQWNNEKLDEDGLPVWEKVAGPFVLDTQALAEEQARQNLEIFSLEITDQSIEKALLSFVANILNNQNFKFCLPTNFEVQYLTSVEEDSFEKITPEKVLLCEHFCFVESDGKWLSGIAEAKGKITTWSKFDDLKTALETMSNKH